MYTFTITGTVQGVGFRPYIYNACVARGLVGFVQNTGTGVTAVVNDKDSFIQILNEVPSHIKVDAYTVVETQGEYSSFTIRESSGKGYSTIPPDLSLCIDCEKELSDKNSRRFQYFFNTCTACGPRFTIAKSLPYDRDTTSMDEHSMCKKCEADYTDPTNRRYHAQTTACPECGPRLTLYKNGTSVSLDDNDAVAKSAELLKNGHIVAIKGTGGFHLACNTHSETIIALKKFTGRTDKPFAVMCKDMEMVRSISHPNTTHKEELLSQERPIVLIPKKNVHDGVSELSTVGVMLPYSALHHLLFEYIDEPIVMTSSNMSDEPITTKREEQKAEYVLDHTRTIVNVADDSVVKIIAGHPLYIRRSRGLVPTPISAPKCGPVMLALGAEMQNTFSIYKPDGQIIPSPHMGNTSNVETIEHYKKMLARFLDFTETTPELIITDMHPSYNTSKYGELLSEELCIPLVRVQHHKAHAYGVALEHKLDDFVAIVADGLGYGEDGTIWGGEIFHNDERVGHLEVQLQVGADSATKHPAKILFSILRNFLSLEETVPFLNNYFSAPDIALLDKQRTDKFNSPLTSSCGRILDAASFLLGFCDERTYDGRPAMLLESHSFAPLNFAPVIKNNVLMTTPLFEFLIEHIHEDKKRLAATVQKYLAEGLYQIASQYKKPITFSGGCAYNTIMTSFMLEHGVLLNTEIPPGDGGISAGQIAYALKHN